MSGLHVCLYTIRSAFIHPAFSSNRRHLPARAPSCVFARVGDAPVQSSSILSSISPVRQLRQLRRVRLAARLSRLPRNAKKTKTSENPRATENERMNELKSDGRPVHDLRFCPIRDLVRELRPNPFVAHGFSVPCHCITVLPPKRLTHSPTRRE